jgi:hypothetical protein
MLWLTLLGTLLLGIGLWAFASTVKEGERKR